jgi:hypothetical protein
LVLVAVVSTVAFADVARVPSEYLTIQEAINAVGEGDTVLVAPGVYAGPSNRRLDFHGVNRVVRSEGGPESTIIDCEYENLAFWFHTAEDLSSLVEGFKIKNGDRHDVGGLLCEEGACVTVRSCVFLRGIGTAGAGLKCKSGSSVVVEGTRFTQNDAQYGGAVMLSGGGSLTMRDCLIEYNEAWYGGGVRCEYSPATFERVVFVGNYATDTCGAVTCIGADFSFEDCTFIGNSAGFCGGIGCIEATVDVTGSTFAATQTSHGGTVHCWPDSDVRIERSVLAYATGAAVRCETGSLLDMSHCVVFANSTGDSLCGHHYENVFEDPAFCGLELHDLTVHESSPCLPGNNPWGVLIGAYESGCGGTPVECTSWAEIKALYR